ncbi:hypothetical protein CORT_0D02540 [Candida orthopsilosis Co 90-125]|uniref:Mitochondrial inner membrane i-AAA protease supercomplex subunit MGR3 n=1 Tax=Candida orthopsilosis (strain 90-125) TaxID=1136231 RepID=H8X507_CANO9|nr:hypothetical protein CORT_0D02540 [Candida orthopsilosis Co 90-125]CCG23100.1 hypothetical protein CORT_0D02540 [Candida orthopsilosis Co 90-125]
MISRISLPRYANRVRFSARRTASVPIISLRSYSQYNYNQTYANYNPPPKTSWFTKLLYATLGVTVISGYAYYMWWPKHTFPSSVAKILRKGLWAESDRGEHDYQLALKYYLEALEHCKEIGMDPLSDEYTGVQLKIGEMFERLGMMSDAAFVYNEIATLYLSVLTAKPADSKGAVGLVSRDLRRHLIQKDLRIAIKLVELNKSNPALCKAILVTHLIIAQDEVNKLGGSTGKLNLVTKVNPGEEGKQEPKKLTATLDNDTILINDESGKEIANIKKTPEVWEPFTDEFFNAMDLLSAICISTGDLAMASKVKIAMTESMLLADVEPGKMLLSQCNLGSLLYMQAEELEAQEITLKRKFAQLADVDYSKLANDSSLKSDQTTQNILKDKIPSHDQELFTKVSQSRQICIQLAIKSYESVLQFAKSIPPEITKQHNEINETVALATYGLGVVNLHLSNYDKAERLLRESRVRSRSCDYEYLIPEIERELKKLFEERKLVQSGKPAEKTSSKTIEMDIHLQ